MIVPPDVQHAMDVAKNQSNVSHVNRLVVVQLFIVFLWAPWSGFAVFTLRFCPDCAGFLQERRQSQSALHYCSRPP